MLPVDQENTVVSSRNFFWRPEPTEDFTLPRDHFADLLSDFVAEHGRELEEPDIAWLAFLLTYFASWTKGHYVQNDLARVFQILTRIDYVMTETDNAARQWCQLAYVFNLPSKTTLDQIGKRFGVTAMCICKSTHRLKAQLHLEK